MTLSIGFHDYRITTIMTIYMMLFICSIFFDIDAPRISYCLFYLHTYPVKKNIQVEKCF